MNTVIDFPSTAEDRCKLTKAKLHQDEWGRYMLDLTYRVENTSTIEEIHLPNIVLPIRDDKVTIKCEGCGRYKLYFVNVGFSDRELVPDKNGAAFTVKTIKTKTKEMTLEEIEKKLGHKVKIVNK